MAPNRVVALAAPLIAPLAGAFAAWLSQAFPGIDVPQEAMEEVFLAVAALVFGMAFQFNHNRYKWDELTERQTTETTADADPLIDGAGDPESYVEDEFPEYDEDDVDFEDDDEFVEPLDDDPVDVPAPARRRPVVVRSRHGTVRPDAQEARRRRPHGARPPAVPGRGDARVRHHHESARRDVPRAAVPRVDHAQHVRGDRLGREVRGPQGPRQRPPRGRRALQGARADPGDRARELQVDERQARRRLHQGPEAAGHRALRVPCRRLLLAAREPERAR